MNIGDRIRLLRKSKGLTQKQLGELCGMADSAIRRYESNRGNPTEKTLQKIADALGVDFYSLASWDQATKALEDSTNAKDRITTALDQLNDAGMVKAADAVEVIAEVPRYQRTAPQERGRATPPAREGKDTTSPSDSPQPPQEGKE